MAPVTGSIECIVGPMFAGKSTELLRRVRRHDIAGSSIRLVKPMSEDRSGNRVHTHDGVEFVAVEKAHLVDALVGASHYDVVAIDECQFFEIEPGDIEIILDLAKTGVRVIFAGVDVDHWGNPFETVADLLAIATDVTKVTAVCADCSSHYATRTQWISDLDYNQDTRVGGADRYAPKCVGCFDPLPFEDGSSRLTVDMVRDSVAPLASVHAFPGS